MRAKPELREAAGGLRATLEYRSDLFDPPRIARMAGQLERLLSEIAEDPSRRVSALPWLSDAERAQLAAWSARPAAAASHRALAELVGPAQPDAPAVVSGERTVSRRDLAAGARRVAHHLRGLGAGPGVVIGLRIDRSPALVAAIHGVLAAGAAYLPIDPAHPAARAAFMLRDGAARLLLTRARWAGELAAPGLRVVSIEEALEEALAPAAPAVGGAPVAPAAPEPRGDDLAYLIYTSGTTGQPKGVMVTRAALANHAAALAAELALAPSDRVLQLASLGVDVAAEEIVPTLLAGACVVLGPGAAPPAPDELSALLDAHAITVVNLTASYWHDWVDELARGGRPAPRSLRLVVVGSERVSPERWRVWRELAGPGVRLLNAYGPSEATITATIYEAGPELPAACAAVPIGRPIANVTAAVLDRALQPVPIGVPGELCLGGAGLARGYLGRPGPTAASFVPDPAGGGRRLYRTGDRACVLPDGQLAYLGRLDRQLKLRGFRIEPQEIERALEDHPQIREAAVTVHDDAVVGYVVAAGAAPAPAELRAHLTARLAAAWVPAVFVALPALPRTAQGKISWRELPAPARPERPRFTEPDGDGERTLARIWSELLRVDRVGRDDNFFDLGGHSLLALQVVARARRAGVVVDPADLIEAPTLRELAARAASPARPRSPLVALRARGSHPPLFVVHPHGGRTLCYRDLAEQLGADQPVLGLEAAGVDGSEPPLERIEDMAARHVEAIRGHQPRGPYAIAGWSYGGLVALEIAQQLTRAGERARLLVLDTALAGTLGDPEPAADGVVGMMARGLEALTGVSLDTAVAALRGLPDREAQIAYLIEQARSLGGLPAELGADQARPLVRVVEASDRAWRCYAPARHAGPILVLRTAEPPGLRADDPTLGWRRVAAGALDVRLVPGRHHRLVFEPDVRGIVEHVRGWLADR